MSINSILLIGGGNMGAAMAARWKDAFPETKLVIAESDQARRHHLTHLGFNTVAEFHETKAELIVLAIKPQSFAALLPELQEVTGDGVLISIMAGIKLGALKPCAKYVARIMPNLPASIGEGISAIYAPGLPDQKLEQVKALFGALGHIVMLDDEEQMHAVTAISGSGPAYVFAFMEALEAAAKKLGLDATSARALATQTVRGAALLADQHGGDAATLRAQVTSPGGTTEAALKALGTDFSRLVEEAVKAAHSRSKALS